MTRIGYVQPQEVRDRRASTRIGVPFEEYRAKRADGLRWCSHHRGWEDAGLFPKTIGKARSYCSDAARELGKARSAASRAMTRRKRG